MVCRKIWKVTAAAAAVLWMLCGISRIGGIGGFPVLAADASQSADAPSQSAADASESAAVPTQSPTEPVPPSEVNITDQDGLINWYKSQSGPNRAIGVISENLIINKKVELKPVTVTGQTKSLREQTPVQLRIKTGPNKASIRIIGDGSLLIEDPALIISGPNPLFYVEGRGHLTLQEGTAAAADPMQPAVLCRYLGQLTINKQCGGFHNLKAAPLNGHEYEPPDESQPPAGNPGQENRPELTEALFLGKGSDGSGTAKLTFENIPSNITALYIYRSGNEISWNKEKNRPASSNQQDQGTLEYENFLKEPGNTLNTDIVEDQYFIYRFQSADRSFYIKTEIESPDGTWETQKLKVAIPEYTGQGLVFGDGWGGYDSYGGWGGSYGGGSSGGSSYQSGKSTTEAETGAEADAPEGPVRRGGRRRSFDFPETPPPADQAASTRSAGTLEDASPSNARASQADAAPGGADPDNADPGDGDKGTSGWDQGLGNAEETITESGMSGNQEAAGTDRHKKIWFAAACPVIFLGGGTVYYIHRRRKKT